MPIEIRRFGVGHRRPDGPPGTSGVTAQTIHADGRGLIAELAFGRGARIEPHANPNSTWLVVIEGGGWVGVGEERTRIAAGEAVLWPPDVPHAAWTEHSEMRAMVVEFTTLEDADLSGLVEGAAREVPRAIAASATPADGSLHRAPAARPPIDPEAGEPA